MRGNPLIDFHRAAEAAGYPALLIVSLVSLGLVVAPIGLLALTQAVWALALALLMLIAAVAILAIEIDAAMSDYGEPPAAPHESEPVAELRRHRPTAREGQDRKAA
jgi:hypothetical protein